MPAERFKALWESYEQHVLDASGEIGAIQRQETRRAFYAGGNALLGMLVTMLDPGTEATANDLQKLNDLGEEFQAFATAVRGGRA